MSRPKNPVLTKLKLETLRFQVASMTNQANVFAERHAALQERIEKKESEIAELEAVIEASDSSDDTSDVSDDTVAAS